MEQTLLQKAKLVPINRKYSKASVLVVDSELEDLAIAWMVGEVTAKQVCESIGKVPYTGNYLYTMATALRQAYRKGKISIVEHETSL